MARNVQLLSNIRAVPYKVIIQYVQISNIIDASIKCAISGKSTPILKGCMDICLIMVDTAFNYLRVLMLISSGIFQGKGK